MNDKVKECGLLQVRDRGLEDYRKTLEMQHRLVEQRRNNEIGDTVLIVEHQPVITLGARQSANKLLIEPAKLAQKGIEVVEIRRGGGTTAHNPGQIVFYPILNLQEMGLGASEYIRMLEQIGIELLEQLGVRSERLKGFPGLWTENRKIASIGVRVSRQVTYHGMAINICNDLCIFDYIVPCGLDDVEMTSVLKETGKEHSMTDIKARLSHLLNTHFGRPKDERRETKDERQTSNIEHRTQNGRIATSNESRATGHGRRLPDWLRRRIPTAGGYSKTSEIVNSLGLETICMNANCPNRGQCWSRGTATVLILGNICTRGCKFCSVAKGKPAPPDSTEPSRIAELAKKLDLR
ncbi:MAG: lipoyl(octanoyl) transferase LipB [Sedimentisphaerales bacterium]|nr:lipoyl(octanoyl) transferase LipB [Sedimentisphaerales bacterium]